MEFVIRLRKPKTGSIFSEKNTLFAFPFPLLQDSGVQKVIWVRYTILFSVLKGKCRFFWWMGGEKKSNSNAVNVPIWPSMISRQVSLDRKDSENVLQPQIWVYFWVHFRNSTNCIKCTGKNLHVWEVTWLMIFTFSNIIYKYNEHMAFSWDKHNSFLNHCNAVITYTTWQKHHKRDTDHFESVPQIHPWEFIYSVLGNDIRRRYEQSERWTAEPGVTFSTERKGHGRAAHSMLGLPTYRVLVLHCPLAWVLREAILPGSYCVYILLIKILNSARHQGTLLNSSRAHC